MDTLAQMLFTKCCHSRLHVGSMQLNHVALLKLVVMEKGTADSQGNQLVACLSGIIFAVQYIPANQASKRMHRSC